MRIKPTIQSSTLLFNELKLLGYDVKHIAAENNVTERTVRDWRRGAHSISQEVFERLVVLSGLPIDTIHYDIVDEIAQKSKAGRFGFASQKQKYGEIATNESRSKGGHSSYRSRSGNPADIFTRSVIKKPKVNTMLAEFVGIMIGDGNIAPYQASVSVNMTDDAEYVPYIARLFRELFGVTVTVRNRTNKNCTVIVVSSANLVDHLECLGLPIGDKISQKISIPEWVNNDPELLSACLRGIFDTDGCIFQEKHKIKGKIYAYPRLSFVSHSPELITSMERALLGLGYAPRVRGGRRVNLEHFTDIEKFFRIIGSSNPKHRKRYKDFMERSHSG